MWREKRVKVCVSDASSEEGEADVIYFGSRSLVVGDPHDAARRRKWAASSPRARGVRTRECRGGVCTIIHQSRGLTEVPAWFFFTVSYRHRFMQLAHILWLHGFDACVTVSRVQMLQSSVLMTLFCSRF